MEAPFDDRLGLRCRSASDGHAVYEAEADAAFHNPMKRLHGGFLAGLADAAMGAAFSSRLGAGEQGTNLDLSLRFLRAVERGPLRATARTVKAGARISLLSCEIEDAQGRLVAVAQSQFMRL